MQGRNRDADVENGHVDTEGRVSGTNWEIRTDKIYTTGASQVAQWQRVHLPMQEKQETQV